MTISAGAIIAILAFEGFTDKAIIPVKGDVPTIGYGTTTRPDGSPVQMGDRITEPEARKRAEADIKNVYQAGIKKCLGETLVHQHEFDVLVDMAYQYGVSKICSSGIVRKFKIGEYKAGCDVILQYRYSQGVDCFLPENAKRCGGIKTRNVERHKRCLGVSHG